MPHVSSLKFQIHNFFLFDHKLVIKSIVITPDDNKSIEQELAHMKAANEIDEVVGLVGRDEEILFTEENDSGFITYNVIKNSKGMDEKSDDIDFQEISDELFKHFLYSTSDSADYEEEIERVIVIHCSKQSNIIASLTLLKLREITIKEFLANPAEFSMKPIPTERIGAYNCTPLVKQAIMAICSSYPSEETAKFIESESNIQALIGYEPYVRRWVIEYPENYRTNKFSLCNSEVIIGGMAGPHRNQEHASKEDPRGSEWALCVLKNVISVDAVIGLNDDHRYDFTDKATERGLEYHYLPIVDFAENTISCDIYDKIYETVQKAVMERKTVVIHCGVGHGRSGTVLVSLKLRELLLRDFRKNQPIPALTEKVDVYADEAMKNLVARKCTPRVKAAIIIIRTDYDNGSGGDCSVERVNDVDSLVQYEFHLYKVLFNLDYRNEIEKKACAAEDFWSDDESPAAKPSLAELSLLSISNAATDSCHTEQDGRNLSKNFNP